MKEKGRGERTLGTWSQSLSVESERARKRCARRSARRNFFSERKKLAHPGIKGASERQRATSRIRSAATTALTNHPGIMSSSTDNIQPGSINDEGNYTEPQLFRSNLQISENLLRRIREQRARHWRGIDIFWEEEQQQQKRKKPKQRLVIRP